MKKKKREKMKNWQLLGWLIYIFLTIYLAVLFIRQALGLVVV